MNDVLSRHVQFRHTKISCLLLFSVVYHFFYIFQSLFCHSFPQKLFKQITHRLSILLIPSISTVSVRFARPSVLILRFRNLEIVLIELLSFPLVLIVLKTYSLLEYSVHGIQNIRLKNQITVASNVFSICDQIVQYYVSYRKYDITPQVDTTD